VPAQSGPLRYVHLDQTRYVTLTPARPADTLRTHIEGIISRHPEWAPELANYRVEATWIVQDWESLSQILESGARGPEISKARVLQAISEKNFLVIPDLLKDARRQIGSTISANHRTYVRNYSALLDLHMLHDLDIIQSTSADLVRMQNISEANKDAHRRSQISELKETLANRLSTISPSFKYQEPVLSMRRAGFNLV
jgi:serine/threonine-protein kinase ATR